MDLLDDSRLRFPDVLEIRAHATCTLGVDVATRGDSERGLELLERAAELAGGAVLLVQESADENSAKLLPSSLSETAIEATVNPINEESDGLLR